MKTMCKACHRKKRLIFFLVIVLCGITLHGGAMALGTETCRGKFEYVNDDGETVKLQPRIDIKTLAAEAGRPVVYGFPSTLNPLLVTAEVRNFLTKESKDPPIQSQVLLQVFRGDGGDMQDPPRIAPTHCENGAQVKTCTFTVTEKNLGDVEDGENNTSAWAPDLAELKNGGPVIFRVLVDQKEFGDFPSDPPTNPSGTETVRNASVVDDPFADCLAVSYQAGNYFFPQGVVPSVAFDTAMNTSEWNGQGKLDVSGATGARVWPSSTTSQNGRRCFVTPPHHKDMPNCITDSIVDTTVHAGKKIKLSIQALNNQGSLVGSVQEKEFTVKPPPPPPSPYSYVPDTPSNFSYNFQDGRLHLSWWVEKITETRPGLSPYHIGSSSDTNIQLFMWSLLRVQVERRELPDGIFNTVAVVEKSSRMVDATARPGHRYEYRLRAFATLNGGQPSPGYLKAVVAVIDNEPPAVPTALVAQMRDGVPYLEWTPGGPAEEGLKHCVYYKGTVRVPLTVPEKVRCPSGVNWLTDVLPPEAQAGDELMYEIEAVDATGNPSGRVGFPAMPVGGGDKDAAPPVLDLKAGGTSEGVFVTWRIPAGRLGVSYRVWRQGPEGEILLGNTVDTWFFDPSANEAPSDQTWAPLVAGTSYIYRVQSLQGTRESAIASSQEAALGSEPAVEVLSLTEEYDPFCLSKDDAIPKSGKVNLALRVNQAVQGVEVVFRNDQGEELDKRFFPSPPRGPGSRIEVVWPQDPDPCPGWGAKGELHETENVYTEINIYPTVRTEPGPGGGVQLSRAAASQTVRSTTRAASQSERGASGSVICKNNVCKRYSLLKTRTIRVNLVRANNKFRTSGCRDTSMPPNAQGMFREWHPNSSSPENPKLVFAAGDAGLTVMTYCHTKVFITEPISLGEYMSKIEEKQDARPLDAVEIPGYDEKTGKNPVVKEGQLLLDRIPGRGKNSQWLRLEQHFKELEVLRDGDVRAVKVVLERENGLVWSQDFFFKKGTVPKLPPENAWEWLMQRGEGAVNFTRGLWHLLFVEPADAIAECIFYMLEDEAARAATHLNYASATTACVRAVVEIVLVVIGGELAQGAVKIAGSTIVKVLPVEGVFLIAFFQGRGLRFVEKFITVAGRGVALLSTKLGVGAEWARGMLGNTFRNVWEHGTAFAKQFEEFLSFSGGCFLAGTQVVTKEGLKAIETVKVGDMVWSKDPQTGQMEWRKVLETLTTYHDEIRRLTYRQAGGEQKELVVTAEHPFWVVNRGAWVPVAELRPSDVFLTAGGALAMLENTLTERGPPGGKITAYNLTVERTHTYFVLPEGEADASLAVWVHNMCPPIRPALGEFVSRNRSSELLKAALHDLNPPEVLKILVDFHKSVYQAISPWGGRAHHIFQYAEHYSDDLGKKLWEMGIDLNGPENAVWLPYNKITDPSNPFVNATLHRGGHSQAYYDYVRTELSKALPEGKQAVLNVLSKIRSELLRGERKL